MLNAKVNSTTHNLLEKSDIFDMLWPVHSIYWEATGYGSDTLVECPLAKYGGTWIRLDHEIISRITTEKLMCLDITNGSADNNTNVQIYDPKDSSGQRWYLSAREYGNYDQVEKYAHGECIAWLRTA